MLLTACEIASCSSPSWCLDMPRLCGPDGWQHLWLHAAGGLSRPEHLTSAEAQMSCRVHFQTEGGTYGFSLLEDYEFIERDVRPAENIPDLAGNSGFDISKRRLLADEQLAQPDGQHAQSDEQHSQPRAHAHPHPQHSHDARHAKPSLTQQLGEAGEEGLPGPGLLLV